MLPLASRPGRVRPVAIGSIAHAALQRTAGRARVLARPRQSIYLTAGHEIVWLAAIGATLHPRAILTAAPAPDAREFEVDTSGLAPWHPVRPALDADTTATVLAGWRRLVLDMAPLGAAGGLGALLTGATLEFPVLAAGSAAGALARACARDDPAAATEAALALLGLGAGLTPSGDDYVGGALFARRLRAGAAHAAAWRQVAAAVVAAARDRTHPISAAILGDLAEGLGWAPLHDLLGALAAGAGDAAREAACRLTRLGHTSGWDVLAGVGAGLGALAGTAPA